MPIPFKDLSEGDVPGSAGFMRFVDEADGKGMQGALFFVSSKGEPLDFCFSRINVHNSFLWRQGDSRRNAVGSLSKALFQASTRTTSLILTLADEVPALVFSEDIQVDIPICRISTDVLAVQAVLEDLESVNSSLSLIWANGRPDQDSDSRKLLESLSKRQLITEPFERALVGLAEVFGGRET